MFLVVFTALTAVCSAAKLDNTYLPPANARTAGGTPESLQAPFSHEYSQTFPVGSYTNEDQGVIVDALKPGTRISPLSEVSGLGGPRASYGSLNSKVGEAAFKDSLTGFDHYPTLHRSIPLDDQDPEYQTSIPKNQAISTKTIIPQDESNSNIVAYENNVGTHEYNYGFASDNGIVVGENGVAHDGVHAQGGYTYKGNDGKTYKVTYTADKEGYKPEGSHLPTPHPVPEDIQKAVEQNVRDEASGVVDDGSYDAQKYNAEGSYKESDNNNYDTQQPQVEKQPEFDAPINGITIVQNNFASPGLPSLPGFPPGTSLTNPATSIPPVFSNFFNNQAKPPSSSGQGFPGLNPFGSGSSSDNKPSSTTAQSEGQFGSFPTIQPGQFNPQIFQNGFGGLFPQKNKDEKVSPTNKPSKDSSQGFLNDFQSSGLQDFSASSSASVTGSQSAQDYQNPQTFNQYQTNQQNTNNEFLVSQEQVPFNQDIQKHPQQSGYQGQKNQQTNPSGQSPFESSTTTGLTSKFGNHVGNTPVKSQNTFGTQLPVTTQQPQGVDNSYYYNQPTKPFNTLAQFSRPQKEESTGTFQVTNKPYQGQSFPTSLINNEANQSSLSSGTQAASSFPSKFPTQSQPFPQNPVQQIFSQGNSNKRPTNEVTQSNQPNNFVVSTNKTPFEISHNVTPQPSLTQQYSGNLYEYKKPPQEQVTTSNKNIQSTLKPQFSQTQFGTVQQSQQSQKEGIQFGTVKPEVEQNIQTIFPSSSTPASTQEQSKPGGFQTTQQYKPFGTSSIFGSPSKPFGTTSQFSNQPIKSFANTNQFGTQTYKPFGSTTQYGTQTYKPFESTNRFGSQPFKTSVTPSEFSTQTTKPQSSIFQFGTQYKKPLASTYKPFGNSYQYGAQPVKTHFGQQQQSSFGQSQTTTQSVSGSSTQFGVQSSKPASSSSQFGTQAPSSQGQGIENQPSGQTTNPFATQTGAQNIYNKYGTQYKPQLLQTQLSTTNNLQQSASQSQFGAQPFRPFSNTPSTSVQGSLLESKFGTQTAQPQESGNTAPFNSVQSSQTASGTAQSVNSQGSQTQFGSQSVIPTPTQQQETTKYVSGTQTKPQVGQAQLPTFNIQQQSVSQNQFVAQSYRPFSNIPSISNQGSITQTQIGTQSSKPQQNANASGAFNSQQSSQEAQGTAQTVNSQTLQPQLSGQSAKPITTSFTQQQETSKYQFGTQTKPQFGQTQLSSSNTQPQSISQNQFVAQSYRPFSSALSTSNQGSITQTQIGTQGSKPQQNVNFPGIFNSQQSSQVAQGTAQTVNSQSSQPQLSGQSAKPITTSFTQQQETSKYQFGTQTKPQFGQTLLFSSNTQPQSISQNKFVAQSYRPFSSAPSTSSQGSLLESKFGTQSTRPQASENVNSGTFESVPSSQVSQESVQTTNSQATQNQFGSQSVKPAIIQSQHQETTKYQFGTQTKPQFGQNQGLIQNTKKQLNSNTAFGQSQTNFGASKPFNFGTQQVKHQFGQNTFPNFGGAHATASASSHSFPGFKFGVQPFTTGYSSTYKPFQSQFGQNYSPSDSSAFASATSSPEPYAYNKPTPEAPVLFSNQPFGQLSTASTPGFLSTQPQFVQSTTPSYDHKQVGTQHDEDGTFAQSYTSNFNSQTVKPLSGQVTGFPQLLPSKPDSFKSACCKPSQSTQTTPDTLSYGSTVTPTFQTSYSQTPEGFILDGSLKPEEIGNQGNSFEGPQQQQRFDEKTGYHY